MQRDIIPGHHRPLQNFTHKHFATCPPAAAAAIEGCHDLRKPPARKGDPGDGLLLP